MQKLNLGDAFELMKLQEKLLNCRPTSFGDSIRLAVKGNKTKEAVKMIKEQIKLGNEEYVEWCVGASTIALIEKLNM